MAERILKIGVPTSVFREAEGPFKEGNPSISAIVEEEVDRVVKALKERGILNEEDEITVNLEADSELESTSSQRRVKVLQVFREAEDGRGSMDTAEDVYIVDMEFPRDN